MTASTVPDLQVRDSVILVRFLLGAAAASGADAVRLARDSQVPGWALAADMAMLPSRHALRLWELAEHTIGVPHAAVAIGGLYQAGSLELFDYLFTTAATLRDALRNSTDFLHVVTSNGEITVTVHGDGATSYTYQHSEGEGSRGSQLGQQFAVLVLCELARSATGRLIVPASVDFAAPPPPSHRELSGAIGTSRLEFGAPATTITFGARDLDSPLRGTDPVLARILRRQALSLPMPPPVTWRQHVQEQIAEMIDVGNPSLDGLARRLAVSTRTLQRQLAEQGTTWRAELDMARRRRALRANGAGGADLSRLARQLGYADPGSARRALRRWDGRAADPLVGQRP